MTLQELHASQVHKWLDCPKGAMYEASEKPEAREFETHVGAHLGETVHAMITGHIPTTPKRVIYDDATQNSHQTLKQVVNMVEVAKPRLHELVPEIVQCERPMRLKMRVGDNAVIDLVGTIDIIGRTEQGDLAIIDLKTGRRPPRQVWTQLAIYCYMHSIIWPEQEIKSAGFLWVKREKKPIPGYQSQMRSCDILIPEGKKIAQRAVQYASGNISVHYSPGSYCTYCRVEDCPMRVDAA